LKTKHAEQYITKIYSEFGRNERNCSDPFWLSSVALGMTRNGNLATTPDPTEQDWRWIAEQTSRETDPAKLTTLVAKLCLALDREREQKPQFRPQQAQTESSPRAPQQNAE